MGGTLSAPVTDKDTVLGARKDGTMRYGCSSMQGWRTGMEDAHLCTPRLATKKHGDVALFAVLDGHSGDGERGQKLAQDAADALGGNIATCYARESPSAAGLARAMQQAMVDTDAQLRRGMAKQERDEPGFTNSAGGATCVAAALTATHIVFANAGDSRCLLARGGVAHTATTDHKPDDAGEAARITQAGGVVVDKRVNGELAVSRGFGDYRFKDNAGLDALQQMVCAGADTTVIKRSADADQFLVLCCDGVFDVADNDEVVQFVADFLAAGDAPAAVCEKLLEYCLAKGSTDNMTACVVLLPAAPAAVAGHAASKRFTDWLDGTKSNAKDVGTLAADAGKALNEGGQGGTAATTTATATAASTAAVAHAAAEAPNPTAAVKPKPTAKAKAMATVSVSADGKVVVPNFSAGINDTLANVTDYSAELDAQWNDFENKFKQIMTGLVEKIGEGLKAEARPALAGEEWDSEAEVRAKASKLAQAIKAAKGSVIVFTGAGISTSAGVPDYRSPLNTKLRSGPGVWTLKDAVSEAKTDAEKAALPSVRCDSEGFNKARPTLAHRALAALHAKGHIRHVISQNVDGLHLRSGMPLDSVTELHGNVYKERCRHCCAEWVRKQPVSAISLSDDTKKLAKHCVHCRETFPKWCHCTKRTCSNPECKFTEQPYAEEPLGKGGIGSRDTSKVPLVNSIVQFGESLQGRDLDRAMGLGKEAELCIVLGSSCRVSPASTIPQLAKATAVVNLQGTPVDDLCGGAVTPKRIAAPCDTVLELVCQELGMAGDIAPTTSKKSAGRSPSQLASSHNSGAGAGRHRNGTQGTTAARASPPKSSSSPLSKKRASTATGATGTRNLASRKTHKTAKSPKSPRSPKAPKSARSPRSRSPRPPKSPKSTSGRNPRTPRTGKEAGGKGKGSSDERAEAATLQHSAKGAQVAVKTATKIKSRALLVVPKTPSPPSSPSAAVSCTSTAAATTTTSPAAAAIATVVAGHRAADTRKASSSSRNGSSAAAATRNTLTSAASRSSPPSREAASNSMAWSRHTSQ